MLQMIMPIAHDRRSIFVHIPKTAGSSITRALARSSAALDYTGVGLWPRLRGNPRMSQIVRDLKRIYPINTISGSAEQHLPAVVLRDVLAPGIWEGYFKFAFVRNPWDLVVSTYHYLKLACEADAVRAVDPDYANMMSWMTFHDFVCAYPMINLDMSASITDRDGNVIVDFVGRVESIEADFRIICDRLGIDTVLEHVNRTEHLNYRQYYTPATQEIVRRHFERDIDRFHYVF